MQWKQKGDPFLWMMIIYFKALCHDEEVGYFHQKSPGRTGTPFKITLKGHEISGNIWLDLLLKIYQVFGMVLIEVIME